MIVYEYDLDMVPGLTQGRTVVSLSQYDDNFFINFHLYTRNGSFVIESGTTARIRGTKPDGNGFSATATVDTSDMTVLVEGDKQMTAAAGTSQYELTLMKGTKELNTANFDVYIERAALDIDTPSSETKLRELYDLPVDEILQAATTAVDAKDDAEDARDAAIAAKDEAVSVTDGLMEIVRGSFIYETASGSIASFSDGGDGLPVKSVSVNVDPVQDTSGGAPSPTNICPITGHTSATITRVGKNLLPFGGISEKGVTISTNSNGEIILNGTSTSAIIWAGTHSILPAGTYSISVGQTLPSGMYVSVNNNSLYMVNSTQNKKEGFTFSASKNCYLNIFIASGTTFNNFKLNPQVEVGTVATGFEPYQSQTYNITFPGAAGTVYGGTLDPVHGTLWVDTVMRTFNGSENWRLDSSLSANGFFTTWTQDGLTPVAMGRISGVFCNAYTVVLKYIQNVSNGEALYNSSEISRAFASLFLVDTRFSSVDTFKSSLASNPIQLVYKLATPVSYSFANEDEITTLLGINHIWADTGDVSVEYAADPKLYINKVIANALNA